jgi:mRNA interferase MazF
LEKESKDYQNWFELKPKINSSFFASQIVPKEGEVWWCSIGINIGIEIDGRHDLFERPVLILRVFSKEHILVAPIRSRDGVRSSFSLSISYNKKTSYVLLSQIRTVSTKRFHHYICTIQIGKFKEGIQKIKDFL